MGNYRTLPYDGGKRGYGIVDQSVIQSDNAAMGKWQRRFNPAIGSIAYHTGDEIHCRSSRLRTVQLECVDACVLLDRIKDLDSCTIYADPPYPTANTTGYAVRDFDRARLADVLMAQRGWWEYPAMATSGICWAGAGLHARHCSGKSRARVRKGWR